MNKYENELILSADRRSWQLSSLHGTQQEKANLPIWEAVWKRDGYRCYYCNFKSDKWQEVHHLDSDHTNNKLENLTTICALCHQSHHLNTASTTNGGKIIWLPELSQQDLNHLCRAIFVVLSLNEEEAASVPFAKMAVALESALEARERVMTGKFHGLGSDAGIFGQVLLNMSPEEYAKRNEFLQYFRLIPARSRFPVQISYWKQHTFFDLAPKDWLKLLKT